MTPRLPSGIIPIIVDLRKSTEGLVSVDSKVVGKNRLLQNYFRLLYAVMARKEYTMRDNSGTWATIDYDGDFVYNIGRLCKCDDTTELSYDSYTCANRTDYTPDSVGTGVEGDESYLEVIKTFGADVPSVALKFNLRTTGGGGLGAVIGHKVVNASASQAVSYRLKFKEPWLRNFAEFLKGVMQDADVGGLVDINGASFTLRIKGTTLADSAKVLIGYGNNPFSPSDTSLTNPKELDSYVIGTAESTYADFVMAGRYTPTSDETIHEIGVALVVYDTGGGTHRLLVIRYVNTDGITLTGGKTYIIGFRITAS